MIKLTLYSEHEITTIIEENKAKAVLKLKEMLSISGYEVKINMDSHITIKNEKYGIQHLTYLSWDNSKEEQYFQDDDLEHIPELEVTMQSKKYSFTAIIQQRSDESHKYGFVRVLLREVRLGKLLFREHLWIPESKTFKNIPNGTLIKFRAKVEDYLNIEEPDKPKQQLVGLKNLTVIKQFRGKIPLDLKHFQGGNNESK